MNLTQEQIIQHMKDGWELGCAVLNKNRYWLQKPRLCCGGETKKVNANTAIAMLNSGKIHSVPKREKDRFWLRRFELRNQGD